MTTVTAAVRRPLRDAGARLAAFAAGAAMLGAVRIRRPDGLRSLCLLRSTTGVPCPFCGSTTAFVRVGQGRVVEALLANPVVLLAAVALVLVPLGAFRWTRKLSTRASWIAVLSVAGASWVWQLGRFGFL